jgi:hypothetical protein
MTAADIVRIATNVVSLGLTVWTLIAVCWIYKHRQNGFKKWTIPLIVLFGINVAYFIISITIQALGAKHYADVLNLVSVIQRNLNATILLMYELAKKALIKIGRNPL